MIVYIKVSGNYLFYRLQTKRPAYNVRFGATAAVAPRKLSSGLNVCSPLESLLKPPLRQAAIPLAVSVESVVEKALRIEN
jgi:hypothetical protein